MNFGSPIWLNQKKKKWNATKWYNIFTIILFSIVIGPDMIFYYLFLIKCYLYNTFTKKNYRWQVITDFKIGHTIVITFLFINSSLAPRIFYEMNVKILWTSHFFFYKELRRSNCENIVTTTRFYNIFTVNLFLVVVSTNLINFYFILSYEKLTL